VALLLATPCLRAQNSDVLTVATPDRLSIKRGASGEVRLKAELRAGFHVNSNTPADEFLIPLRLTWAKEPLEVEEITFPKPQSEKYDFSPNPVSVFSGTFEIVTRFKAPPSSKPGMAIVTGKLRYQACNNKECLAPKTLEVRVTADLQ